MKNFLFFFPNPLGSKYSGSTKISNVFLDYLESNFSFNIDSFTPYDTAEPKFIKKQYFFNNPLDNIFLKVINKILNLFIINHLKKDIIYKFFVKKQIKSKLDLNFYDAIIVNYVQFLKLIPNEQFHKVICFTHDIYFFRQSSFLKKNFCNKIIIKLIKDEEIRRLKKCKIILILAEYERDILLKNNVLNEKIINIGMPLKLKSQKNQSNFKYDFIFVGVNTEQNVDALLWFIKKYNNTFTNRTFGIVGSVCESKTLIKLVKNFPNISLIGFVEDLDKAYQKSKFVVAPIQKGSGIKIKVLEALSYQKIIFATDKAVEGILINRDEHYINIDNTNDQEFNLMFSKVSEPKAYNKMLKNIKSFVENNFNEKVVYKELREKLKL